MSQSAKCCCAALPMLLCSTLSLVAEDVTESIDFISRSSSLVSALAGEDAVAKFMAEEQLVEMGDAAVSVLEPLATSPRLTLARQQAINVLARISSEKAIQLLLRVLEQEQDVKVRSLVCRHLGRLGVTEAVPIISKWLFSIQGKSLSDWDGPKGGDPQVLTRAYAWIVHVHALREIGSEKGIPVLERMLAKKHGGKAGRALTLACRQSLSELEREAAFWNAVRRVPGLERHVMLLFRFCRRDALALMRLYRDKIVHLGLEGRWVLESMVNYPDEGLRRAAAALLREYDNLKVAKNDE